MNFKIKYFLLVAFTFGLLPIASLAQEDINVDPLFVPEEDYYQPITKDNFEEEKVKALQRKDQKKMYTIGLMYRDGENVEADTIQALEWLKSAAELGNSDAMIELSKIYSLDKEFTGIDKNKLLATKWISEAEKRNNPKAIFVLGLMYEEGFPYERSFEKSFEYYKKAANRGILNAYVKMYIAYQYGKGVEPDLKKAIYWLRKIQADAAEGNVKNYAKEMLSDIYFELALKEQDQALKFKLFNMAWANGNRYSVEAIGDMMQAGLGVKQSYTSAIVAYETAIKKYESVYAMERLGFIYLKGPAEIDRDYAKAYQLFKKSADLGGTTGAYMMGYVFHYGLGVQKDAKQAKMWFDRSKQFAQRKRVDINRIEKTDDASGRALQNILSDANEREGQRLDAFENKTKANGGVVGPGLPELPDVPKY